MMNKNEEYIDEEIRTNKSFIINDKEFTEYSNEEYAKKAIEANKKGKLLIMNNNDELELIDIVKTDEDVIFENTTNRELLVSEATQRIEILQDIVSLDMQATNEDEQLLAWKKYRILLTRIDISKVNVDWPEKPE